jgi:hypothetical protein
MALPDPRRRAGAGAPPESIGTQLQEETQSGPKNDQFYPFMVHQSILLVQAEH